ncbi:Uncharacterised protein [Yersinia enterocolitica]|nr:Uncharacterised protein [Yersinia enterocolitica]
MSALLRTTVIGSVAGKRAINSGQIVAGSVASVVVPSTINSTRSACSISCHARSIPMRSTSSLASRRPAVSIICNGIPSIWICSRNTSRVVPAISVTIAASRPANALSKLDFPAFGRPAMTTFIPSRSKLPCRASVRTCSKSAITPFN